jgi:uncharacterized damage-inducible protein DinB
MKRPEATEYVPYFHQYIQLVKGDHPIKALENQIIAMQAFLSEIPEEKENFRYAEGKWSIKEIIGHLIDTERIFGYRALCYARGDKTNLPGFEENDYVANANFEKRSFYNLVHEYNLVRTSHLALFKSFDANALNQIGIANGNKLSVRAIIFIIAGHELHHLKVIREKYLK